MESAAGTGASQEAGAPAVQDKKHWRRAFMMVYQQAALQEDRLFPLPPPTRAMPWVQQGMPLYPHGHTDAVMHVGTPYHVSLNGRGLLDHLTVAATPEAAWTAACEQQRTHGVMVEVHAHRRDFEATHRVPNGLAHVREVCVLQGFDGTIDARGTRVAFQQGVVHCLNGPAIHTRSGTLVYRRRGCCHRVGGPAVITADGIRQWLVWGRLHRLGGPAVEGGGETPRYYLNNVPCTAGQVAAATAALRGPLAGMADAAAAEEEEEKEEAAAVHELTQVAEWWALMQEKAARNKQPAAAHGPAAALFGPVVERIPLASGGHKWRRDGQLHAEKEPARVLPDGTQEWYFKGKLHREGGPAVVKPQVEGGLELWYRHGELHRVGGPAYVRGKEQRWYVNGALHREDGPALWRANGVQEWYARGLRHRSDGPAVVGRDGSYAWYANGRLHRTDGPAVRRADGASAYYRHGKLHRDDGPAVQCVDGGWAYFQHGVRHRVGGPAWRRRTRREDDAAPGEQWQCLWYWHGKDVTPALDAAARRIAAWWMSRTPRAKAPVLPAPTTGLCELPCRHPTL